MTGTGRRARARAAAVRTGAIALLFAGAGACDEGVHFADAIDLESDFRATDDDELHTPYAIGATVVVFARGPGLHGATLESSDPHVLEVVALENPDEDGVSADAIARGPGVAELRVVDADGDTIASTDIEVRVPSRAVLHGAAAPFVERDDLAEVSATPYVLASGTAAFEVRLYDGTTRLYGHGGLSAHAEPGVDVDVLDVLHEESRDWLVVTPHSPGNHEIRLLADGVSFATTVVAAVGDEMISDVRLHGGDDDVADDGEWVPIIAQAYGPHHEPIHGVTFAWELAGELADDGGELWRYRVDRRARHELAVRHGIHQVAATIHAAKP
jgi:hypothetical protein